MNLLAHSHLGKDLDEISNAVNVLWDFIGKGFKDDPRYFYQEGKERHLLIDRLADGSKYYKKGKEILSPDRRKISNLLNDVFSDYFLAKNWSHFSDKAVEDHLESLYTSLMEHSNMMGEKAWYIRNKINKKWFFNCLTINGTRRIIDRISLRASTSARKLLKGAVSELLEQETEFEEGFLEFYDDMVCRVSSG